MSYTLPIAPEVLARFELEPHKRIWLNEARIQIESDPTYQIWSDFDIKIRAAKNWWKDKGHLEYLRSSGAAYYPPIWRYEPGPAAETVAPDRIWFEAWGDKPK